MWRVSSLRVYHAAAAAALRAGLAEVKIVTRPERDQAEIGERESAEIRSLAARVNVDRPIVLVGLMGAGKTTVGRRLAAALALPFIDADAEIERAARLTVSEIFEMHGEAEFRRGERSVIARLLNDPPHVLATGGGAFIDPATRALVKEKAISVWLKAPIEVLMRRVEKRETRPLLRGDDPEGTMRKLMADRYPIYAEADLTMESTNARHNTSVLSVLKTLAAKNGAAE